MDMTLVVVSVGGRQDVDTLYRWFHQHTDWRVKNAPMEIMQTNIPRESAKLFVTLPIDDKTVGKVLALRMRVCADCGWDIVIPHFVPTYDELTDKERALVESIRKPGTDKPIHCNDWDGLS